MEQDGRGHCRLSSPLTNTLKGVVERNALSGTSAGHAESTVDIFSRDDGLVGFDPVRSAGQIRAAQTGPARLIDRIPHFLERKPCGNNNAGHCAAQTCQFGHLGGNATLGSRGRTRIDILRNDQRVILTGHDGRSGDRFVGHGR